MKYLRNYFRHPKVDDLYELDRYDHSKNVFAKHCAFIRKNGLHKMEIFKKNTGRGYCSSWVWDAKNYRGCLTVNNPPVYKYRWRRN